VLLLIGALRELIGEGSLFAGAGTLLGLPGLELAAEGYPGFVLAILPVGAFVVLAGLVAIRQAWRLRQTSTAA
jgi:electron transport complex protein RnfE